MSLKYNRFTPGCCNDSESDIKQCCRRRIITDPLHATINGTINVLLSEPILPWAGYYNGVHKSSDAGFSFEMVQSVSPPGAPFAFSVFSDSNNFQEGRHDIYGNRLIDRRLLLASFTIGAIDFFGNYYTSIIRYYFAGFQVGCAQVVRGGVSELTGIMVIGSTVSHRPDGLGGPDDETGIGATLFNSTGAAAAEINLVACDPLHLTGTFYLVGVNQSATFGFEITE